MASDRWRLWLDAISFGHSEPQRPGVDGAGGVLRASHGCGGELVGVSPFFLVDDVVSTLPWWWGWGLCKCLSVAPRWGSRLCLALLAETLRKQWERATVLVLIRAKAFPYDVSGDGGGALWASFSLAGGTMLRSTGSSGENPVR
jgi:hypothetical protein